MTSPQRRCALTACAATFLTGAPALANGLRASPRDGDTGALRPDEPFDGPESRNYETANRIVKCADGHAPTPRRVAADIRRIRRLDPRPILTGIRRPPAPTGTTGPPTAAGSAARTPRPSC